MKFSMDKVGQLFALLLMASGSAMAAESAFEMGVGAFKKQDFRSAIEWFDKERGQGNHSPILSYNLAVSHYKLAQYGEARRYFTESASDVSLAGLSYYNLGLVALKQGDEKAARTAFLQSIELAQDENVRLLAAQRLDKLQAEKSGFDVEALSGFVSLSAAHDDNVGRVNDDLLTVANQSDSYLDLFGTLNYQLSGNRDDGLQLKGGLVMTRYSDLSAYDENLFSIGVYRTKPLASWQGRGGVLLYHDTLGGTAFQRRFALQLRADNHYAKGRRLRLKYDLTQYDDLDANYAYLSGTKQRLSVEHRNRSDRRSLNLGYRLELNDRDDYVALNTFSSYSPTRHTLFGIYEYELDKQWLAQASLDYRSSSYDQANVVGGVSQGVREEDRIRYDLAAIYRYNRDTEFEARWRYTDNSSNYTSENYNSTLLMFSANHYF